MVTYTIAAEENYDPTTVAANFPDDFYYADQLLMGMTYDRVRRVILTGSSDANPTMTNTTGFYLWDGDFAGVAIGANYNGNYQGGRSIMSRPIDLPSNVTKYSMYNAANVVPAGLGPYQNIATFTLAGGSGYSDGIWYMVPLTGGHGLYAQATITVGGGVVTAVSVNLAYLFQVGDVLTTSNANLGGSGSGFSITVTALNAASDGTWRRIVDFYNSGQNGNCVVNPANGDFWSHSNAFAGSNPCVVYQLRRADSFALNISPMQPIDGTGKHCDLRGMTNNYVYTIQYNNDVRLDGTSWLVGTPIGFTAAELAVDYKLPYFWFACPFTIRSNAAWVACAFSTDNKVYQLWDGGAGLGYNEWFLYRFDEPSSATPYNQATVGGVEGNITPWSATTGPNTGGQNYIGNTSEGNPTILYYLPATNQLVCISRLYPQDFIGGGTQSEYRQDCTYVSNPEGAATFEYHPQFVTGFMDANWNPIISAGTNVAPAGAAYAVIDSQEVDPYINFSSYHYTDAAMDYTTRWFLFTTVQVTPGQTFTPPANVYSRVLNTFSVLVQYKFVVGSPPQKLQFQPETPWDVQLPLNPDWGGLAGVGCVDACTGNQDTGQVISSEFNNTGIFDPVTQAFWFSGQASNPMWHVSSYFLNRSNSGFNPACPYLRLSFGTTPPPAVGFTQGHIF